MLKTFLAAVLAGMFHTMELEFLVLVVKRRPAACLAAVLSFGSSRGLFLALVTLGGNSEPLYH